MKKAIIITSALEIFTVVTAVTLLVCYSSKLTQIII